MMWWFLGLVAVGGLLILVAALMHMKKLVDECQPLMGEELQEEMFRQKYGNLSKLDTKQREGDLARRHTSKLSGRTRSSHV